MLNLTNKELIIRNKETGEDTVIPPSGTIAGYEVIFEDFEYNPAIAMDVIRRDYEVFNVPSLPCEPFIVEAAVLRRLDKSYRGVAFTWEDRDLREDGRRVILSLRTI